MDEPNKQLFSDITQDNVLNYPSTMAKAEKDGVLSEYRVELTTKRAVELFLEGTLRSKVCRYCLSVASPLSDLDQILQIAGKGALHKVTIRDMVACFYPFKALNDPNFPSKICNKCLNRTISAYLFTQQCEQSERALRNCFEDLYDKLEKLDPLERTKKRGRQKLNPNYNTLYTDYQKVIDYAEPMWNIINSQSASLSKEKYISDLECLKCWQIFTKIDDLIIHEKSHPKNMWFNCRLCGKSFVKRMQLKRHWKQAHRGPELQTEIVEKTDFQCSTCGFISHDHSVYLQHIEKHKFQSILEHIVEKNMDKLCAVCLDRKPNLVELDKMVRLHGGYPGVTGDKTLYSILGSTLPDRKSYKYQELYVPHHAKIMKIVKLSKEKQPQNKAQDNSGCNVNQIIFSNPLIISNDKFDCDEMFLFFFADPIFYKDDGKDTYSVGKCSEDKDNDSVSKGEINNNLNVLEKQCEKINKDTKVNELNANEIDVNIDNIECVTPVNEPPCKTCWIFNKPTCMKCINKQMKAEQKQANVESNDTKDKCKYCWIFKTSDKCGICNNYTRSIVTTDFNTTADYINTKLVEDINVDLQRKRKLTDDNIKPKKKKWECQICLTTNVKERKTCFCCESNKNNQGNIIKVNFDSNHSFKMFQTDNTTDATTCEDEVCSQIHNTLETDNIHEEIKTLQAQTPVVDTTNMANSTKFYITHHRNSYDNFKTFESSNNHMLRGKNIDETEEMDIAEDDGEIVIPLNPNPFSLNITAHPSNVAAQLKNIECSGNILLAGSGLSFNIGAGSSKVSGTTGRRIARAVRRMAYNK